MREGKGRPDRCQARSKQPVMKFDQQLIGPDAAGQHVGEDRIFRSLDVHFYDCGMLLLLFKPWGQRMRGNQVIE